MPYWSHASRQSVLVILFAHALWPGMIQAGHPLSIEALGWEITAGTWQVLPGRRIQGDGLSGSIRPARINASQIGISFLFDASECGSLHFSIGGGQGVWLDNKKGTVRVVDLSNRAASNISHQHMLASTDTPAMLSVFEAKINLKKWHRLSAKLDFKRNKVYYKIDNKEIYAASSTLRTMSTPSINFSDGRVYLKNLMIHP